MERPRASQRKCGGTVTAVGAIVDGTVAGVTVGGIAAGAGGTVVGVIAGGGVMASVGDGPITDTAIIIRAITMVDTTVIAAGAGGTVTGAIMAGVIGVGAIADGATTAAGVTVVASDITAGTAIANRRG